MRFLNLITKKIKLLQKKNEPITAASGKDLSSAPFFTKE